MPAPPSALERHESAGTRLRLDGLDVFHRAAGPGRGVPVVLLHGLPHSSFLYRRVLPILADTHPVFAPDWPGFGLSDKPAERGRYTLPALERFLGLYLDSLGAGAFHLVCHDIAGPPAVAWAARHPGRVASLTVLDTTLGLRGFRLPGVVAAGIALPWLLQRALLSDEACAELLWSTARRRGLARPEALDGAEGEAFRALFLRAGGRRAVTWLVKSYWGAPRYLAEVRRAAAGFSRPALVLWGARDPWCTVEAGRRLAATLGTARFEALADASHFVPEDAPAELAVRLETWLARLPP